MTGPDDSNSNTRPISVAELLARNGTIGAPPIGGRRRRRRGDTDAVTVAELTGEIPIVRDDTDDTVDVEQADTGSTPAEAAPTNGAVDNDAVEAEIVDEAEPEREPVDEYDDLEAGRDDEVDDEYADAVADYTAHVEHRDEDPDVDFFAPPRRSSYAPRRLAATGLGAERMSPDPVVDWDHPGADADKIDEIAIDEVADDNLDDLDDTDDRDELPSYLRSTDGPLFGGQTVADDVARRGPHPGPEDIDLEDEADTARPSRMSSVMRAALVVGQCIIAVAFGGGLFIAFDQLWKWNNIVALVLSVLVILGLVVGVRVVRKTEDIGSTLIAVAVGALVTLGPLALLQSG